MNAASELELEIVQGRTPDLPPADTYVVIDVLRAFTTTHVAFRRGASDILLAREVEEARQLAARFPDALLAGERDARPLEGFDVGNSPHDMGQLDLEGRRVILTTTNGVRATTHVLDHGRVLVAGWSSVLATCDHLSHLYRTGHTRRLVLVASHPVSDEDVACAEYIRSRLLGTDALTPADVLRRICRARSAQKFQVTDVWAFEDLHIALQRHPPEMAMVVEQGDTHPRIVPVSPRSNHRD